MGPPAEQRPLTVRLLMAVLVLNWIDFMAVLVPEYFACGPDEPDCESLARTDPGFLTVLVAAATLLLLCAFGIWHRRTGAWFLALVVTAAAAAVLAADFGAWLASPPLELLAGVLDLVCVALLLSRPVLRWVRLHPKA